MDYLIVIDMQNDFVSGPLGTPEARAIVPRVAEKISQYRHRANADIFVTMDTHDDDYLTTGEGHRLPVPHCIDATPGWCLNPEIQDALYSDFKIRYKNAFAEFGWDELLFAPSFEDRIELVGVCTDICVISNALVLRSMFPKATIAVDASCCAGTTPEAHEAALLVMKSCQIEITNEG